MHFKLVIFDFDGTLADTKKAIILSKQEAMRLMGLPVADDAACASIIGLEAGIGFRKLFPILTDEDITAMVQRYRVVFEEIRHLYPLTFFPHTDEVLEIMRGRGITSAIATSRNAKTLHAFLDEWGLSPYFACILCAEDTPLLKPHPDPVLKILKTLSFQPEETLVVGDMSYDIEMGRSAGVCTCAAAYGNAPRTVLEQAQPDYIIDRIEELPAIL